MKRALVSAALAALTLAATPHPALAKGFDWEVEEKPAGPALSALRNFRDGLLGLLDDATDLQLAVFSEASLLLSTGLTAGSDVVGLVDDNPVSQHVFKGVASKSLAKTAYLLHLAGSEAILGSHGLEAESWASQALEDLNPLLDEEDKRGGLPLEPLAFVGEGMVHADVYRARTPLRIGLTALATDGVLRPVGNLLRAASATGSADALEAKARAWMRGAVDE
jgi:hypothetical protein